jgi:Protein of unknown function (DUF3106)
MKNSIWNSVLLLLFFSLVASLLFAQEVIRDERWRENYRRWQTLPEERKQQLRDRFAELRTMTPDERKQFAKNAEIFRQLPAQDKERLHKRLEFLRNLSENQRASFRKLARFYRTLPMQRKSILKRRFLLLRAMPPLRRELLLRRLHFWSRMTDPQRERLRNFLFDQGSASPHTQSFE